MAPSSISASITALILAITATQSCEGFSVPSSRSGATFLHVSSVTTTTAKTSTPTRGTRININNSALFASDNNDDKSLFFADDTKTTTEEAPKTPLSSTSKTTATTTQLFDAATLAEANDALESVGWSGVSSAPMQGEGEMTSEDPFVKRIDESIRSDMGVGLDELLNPAKVVNLERDLYNLRNELATLTGATLPSDDDSLTTALCDAGGGGEPATALRAKITKKENDLARERRAVFRGWLKNVFLGQALLSTGLSYVMATNPDALFGGFALYRDTANMDTSIQVLGFWWWWLFIVPSLRSRRPTGAEKKALDIAFLGTPAISLLSPVVTKDTGIIWFANLAVVAGAYGFAFLAGEEDAGDDDNKKQPGWLRFIYKSLDFGSGRERGARQ